MNLPDLKELRIFGVSNCNSSILTSKQFPLYLDLGYHMGLMTGAQREYIDTLCDHASVQRKKVRDLQCTLRKKCEGAANISHSYTLEKCSSLRLSNLQNTQPNVQSTPVKPYLSFKYNKNTELPVIIDCFADSDEDFSSLLGKIAERRSLSPSAIREEWFFKRSVSPERQDKLPKLGYTKLREKLSPPKCHSTSIPSLPPLE
ncbi:hypothetical protein GL50803_0087492 [Giardia duodenalis]|uniref:Uncharacterized protein n=2 Tax=Giardia intestinalis TaxID=5741 RepID=D3KI16_GIAIC|nr:hypothetical protein GL50803_0087492 [Giardia intestinalis]ESU36295.1 Hypothetical protein DHA2_150442 [Giardia intestinalis]KAE8301268.1 hypothetical protein GL50803_0087492 [Giardia intestinalis]